jgi:hypothetical protein
VLSAVDAWLDVPGVALRLVVPEVAPAGALARSSDPRAPRGARD